MWRFPSMQRLMHNFMHNLSSFRQGLLACRLRSAPLPPTAAAVAALAAQRFSSGGLPAGLQRFAPPGGGGAPCAGPRQRCPRGPTTWPRRRRAAAQQQQHAGIFRGRQAVWRGPCADGAHDVGRWPAAVRRGNSTVKVVKAGVSASSCACLVFTRHARRRSCRRPAHRYRWLRAQILFAVNST